MSLELENVDKLVDGEHHLYAIEVALQPGLTVLIGQTLAGTESVEFSSPFLTFDRHRTRAGHFINHPSRCQSNASFRGPIERPDRSGPRDRRRS